MIRALALCASVAALAGCTAPDLPRFQAALAAQDSATQALQQWCAARGIADSPVIRALADRDGGASAPESVRAALGAGPQQPLAFRHVRLVCGDTVLSDARNWYVPARLTPAMNATLETTDTPFGTVVRPLGFHRERLDSRRGRGAGCPAGTILTHRAVLRLANGQAISLVTECYTAANLRAQARPRG